LYYLNLNADLVVLSACETGLGKLYAGEGAQSISRGFQMAGAKNLLFSLWKVNDYTTSVFMQKFYSHLKKNQSYFEANHSAKLQYLKDTSISNAKKSPYYWCAMVYYGNLQKSNATDLNYFYLAVALFISLVLILNIKKGSHF
jgi:CHAT domain-containing protein